MSIVVFKDRAVLTWGFGRSSSTTSQKRSKDAASPPVQEVCVHTEHPLAYKPFGIQSPSVWSFSAVEKFFEARVTRKERRRPVGLSKSPPSTILTPEAVSLARRLNAIKVPRVGAYPPTIVHESCVFTYGANYPSNVLLSVLCLSRNKTCSESRDAGQRGRQVFLHPFLGIVRFDRLELIDVLSRDTDKRHVLPTTSIVYWREVDTTSLPLPTKPGSAATSSLSGGEAYSMRDSPHLYLPTALPKFERVVFV